MKKVLKSLVSKAKHSDSQPEESKTSSKTDNKPTKQTNYYETKKEFTLSIVVPSSIVDNAQSLELKTYLVGQIAKAAAILQVNEIIVLSNDKTQARRQHNTQESTTEFFVKNLEYLETPQYLRKALFPVSQSLKYSGLMNPIDTPHHLRVTQWYPYREGAIIKRPVKDGKGSWANIGLLKDCQVDLQLEEGTRVTIKLNETDFLDQRDKKTHYTGQVVA